MSYQDPDTGLFQPALSSTEILPRLSRAGFKFFKRAVDLGFVLFLFPGLLFCMAILFTLNRFVNPGPMFFVQERVGRNGQVFRMLKFRTMVGGPAGERFATQEIGRISGLGAFMRRTRVDEVPQILNVLLGQMSMIGPRPEQPSFYGEFARIIPGYTRRQVVLPGISGLAQLKYGYTDDAAGAARKLRWDMEYINRQGFGLELLIVWQTFRFVMCRLLRIPNRTRL